MTTTYKYYPMDDSDDLPNKWVRLCSVCGERNTRNRKGVIDERSLARKIVYVCLECAPYCWPEHMAGKAKEFAEKQAALAEKRAVSELDKITDNSGDPHVDGTIFLEQFGAKSRKIIRSFLKSDFSEATIRDASIGALKQSIDTLCLGKIVYAEQRDNTVVLRRIN